MSVATGAAIQDQQPFTPEPSRPPSRDDRFQPTPRSPTFAQSQQNGNISSANTSAHSSPQQFRHRSSSQHSVVARSAIMSSTTKSQAMKAAAAANSSAIIDDSNTTANENGLVVPSRISQAAANDKTGVGGIALNDTPATTAPSSPNFPPKRQNSYDKVRIRPTTLDIPGLTKSKVSPDGRIAQRDVGSKLVIVMVGLPARGKSYITKKLTRYLNWLQHDTRIFNVGERRRVAAGSGRSPRVDRQAAADASRNGATVTKRSQDVTDILRRHGINRGSSKTSVPQFVNGQKVAQEDALAAARALTMGMNAVIDQGGDDIKSSEILQAQGTSGPTAIPELRLPESTDSDAAESEQESKAGEPSAADVMDQSAAFFDPSNRKAALLREQVALETLDELLNYILDEGGAVGILDATNSTLARRKLVMKHIRAREPNLNVLFLESMCVDEALLERNMRLKLSGPDYQGKDPEASLADFKKRVAIYEKNYTPLGEYEEKNNMSFVQMIDVGRKVISHQIKGFLSAQAVYYLLNFNLAPRQIWITRHGQSLDNISGNIGGDAELAPAGHLYGRALTKFISHERRQWEIRELDKERRSHLPPQRGDATPPNPHYAEAAESHILNKNFCVWTSMLKRSIQTAQYFDEEEYEIKQMRMLNELYAGYLEGLTYDEIKDKYAEEFNRRREDKLQYRYPGPGGEGYLDVINRLRPVIVELERMTDHVLLVGHRSVVRVLLAYFKGLPRDQVTDLNVPLGMLYCLEPKPYGVDIRFYRYNAETGWFDHEPKYEMRKAYSHHE